MIMHLYFSVLFCHTHRYKSYPTAEELDHVVQQIYKWPFLQDKQDFVSKLLLF